VIIRLLIILALAVGIFNWAYKTYDRLYVAPDRIIREQAKTLPTELPPDPTIKQFEEIMAVRSAGQLAAAKLNLEGFIRQNPNSPKYVAAIDALGEINSEQLFSRDTTEDKEVYVVKSGDSPGRIVLRSKMTMELFNHLNRLNTGMIFPGQKLLVVKCDFTMVINQKTQRVILSKNGKYFRQYPILSGTGSAKKTVVYPKQNGKLTDKRVFNEKGVVKATDPGFMSASHQIIVTIPNCSLYSQPEDPEATVHRPPGGGAGLAPAHIAEIALLLPKNTPVSIE